MEDAEISTPTIKSNPGDQEMERTADSTPQQDPSTESLKSKLLAHYQKGLKKPKPRNISSFLTPEVINRMAVPLYLFTVLSTLKIGIIDVMPLIYKGWDNVVFLQQCLVAFIFSELMTNWFGIRYIDSSYPRYRRLHGDVKSGKSSANGNLLLQASSSDSSSAVLMPLITETNETKQVAKSENDELLIGTNLKSAGAIMRDATSNLTLEADRANEEMDKRNEILNSRSIADLINLPENDITSSKATPPPLDKYSGSVVAPQSGLHSVTSPKPTITTDGKTVTKTYPYWSWAPCYDCGWTRPPRCHHCPLCSTCVLKRDHHCFFAGSCVGYRNHRFFCVFLVWAFIGCVYATLHGFPYIAIHLWSDMSYFDVIFPIAIVRFLIGYLPFQAALSVTTLTLLLYFDTLTLTFIYVHSRLISWGLTSFEKACVRNSLQIKDSRKLDQKIRAVFGPYWLLCFFFPTHFFFEPEEDPVNWPDISVVKH